MTRKAIITCIFLISAVALKSQSRWSTVYYEEKDAIGNAIINSYDNGILITGKHGSNYVQYNWLIKADINGNVIWEKTFGDPNTNLMIADMSYNQNGELYLVGLTSFYNEDDYDPIIIKLNACGEKEWCRVFYEERNNFSNAVVVTPDGGCVVLLRYMSTIPFTDRICLSKFNEIGTLVWKQCYNSNDSAIYSDDAYDLTITPDGGYLITGVCDYQDPNPPHSLWMKPYYIKTDSSGNFEWETVVHKDNSDIGGSAWSTVINMDTTYYYSSISHYYHPPFGDAASLLKMDFSGNVVDIYDLAPPNYYGKMIEAKFITDSTLAASAIWGSEGNALPPKAVVIDTLGNILAQSELLDNDRMAEVEITFDKKLLFFTNMLDEQDEFDAYLFKLNQNLESDTIYTQYFTYDSLCTGEIISDTIVQDDCGIIVGNVEIYRQKEENEVLIFPNPATGKFTIESPLFEKEDCLIEVISLQGEKILTMNVKKGETEIHVGTREWSTGLYVVRIISREGIVSRKVVVQH